MFGGLADETNGGRRAVKVKVEVEGGSESGQDRHADSAESYASATFSFNS